MSPETLVIEILAQVLGISPDELLEEEEISMQALPEWDSLTHTKIILDLEKKLGKRFNPAAASQATSLENLVRMIAA